MLISEDGKPSLAAVLAFAMLEPVGDVARVHRAAANRLARTNPWRAYRIIKADVADEPDGLMRIRVHAAAVAIYGDTKVLEFLVGSVPARRSQRLDALLVACGVKHQFDDTLQFEGRYFAVRNNGRTPADFAPLERSFNE